MTQKRMAEPRALCGALDKPGDIRRDKARAGACGSRNDAEHGGESRKMIIGDLGTRRAYA